MENGKSLAVGRSSSEDHAKKVLEEILDKVQSKGWTLTKKALSTIDIESEDDRVVPISSRVSYIKINGKGHSTPVTDFKTMVEIIRLLGREIEEENVGRRL